MATARFPVGTKIYAGDDLAANSPAYTEITEVSSIGIPVGYSVDEEETTTHGSAGTSKTRRFGSTLADSGEISGTVLFDWEDSEHQDLATRSWGRTKRAWKIELPIQDSTNSSNATYVFDGYIRNFASPDANAQNHISVDFTIRVADEPSFTAEAV